MKFKAFHKLSYGLYIISSEYEGKKAGYIGNTAFQITSSPPQVAISCHKNNATADIIIKSRCFSLSVLKKNTSTKLIGEFGFMSSNEIDKFKNTDSITSKTGSPIVTDSAIAWFDCKVVNYSDVGSHILIIGEVLESEIISGEEPLTYDYYREKYKMVAPKNAPTFIEKEKLENEYEPEPTAEPEHKEIQEKKPGLDNYTCSICGFQYDPAEGDPAIGIPPGTSFEELPEDYKCPICNAGKDYFSKN